MHMPFTHNERVTIKVKKKKIIQLMPERERIEWHLEVKTLLPMLFTWRLFSVWFHEIEKIKCFCKRSKKNTQNRIIFFFSLFLNIHECSTFCRWNSYFERTGFSKSDKKFKYWIFNDEPWLEQNPKFIKEIQIVERINKNIRNRIFFFLIF